MTKAELAILIDLDGRLRTAEGILEGLLGQQREHLIEREEWRRQRAELLVRNAELVKCWRDAVRRKEAILEVAGARALAGST